MSNPVRREGVMERQVGKDQMLYDSVSKAVHVINESALFIWQRCDGSHSVAEIVSEAVAASGVPEGQIRADVEECLAMLREKKLLSEEG